MKYGNVFLLVMALLIPLSGAVWGQGPAYHLGRTPTPEEIKAWDIAIGPEGKELPPGRGTVQEGEKIYAQRCAKCHGPTATEAKFLHGPLVGGLGSLPTLQPLKTVKYIRLRRRYRTPFQPLDAFRSTVLSQSRRGVLCSGLPFLSERHYQGE